MKFQLHEQVKEENGFFFLPIDFQQFRKMCEVEEFFVTLEEKPKVALSCMGAAVHKVQSVEIFASFLSPVFLPFCVQGSLLLSSKQVLLTKWENILEDGTKINIRLHNYPESMIALKNLKAAYIGNFRLMHALQFHD